MTKFILGLGLLVAACGGSDDGGPPKLDGLWHLELQQADCVGIYDFNGSRYSDGVICRLQNGSYGLESESGSFSPANGAIDFAPTKSSCRAHAYFGSANYTLASSQLTLGFPSYSIILKRTAASDTQNGAAVLNGCWDFSQAPPLFTVGAIGEL